MANINIDQDKNFSRKLKFTRCPNLKAIRDGNMNPNDTAVVAPVNLKAVHILGIIVDPR